MYVNKSIKFTDKLWQHPSHKENLLRTDTDVTKQSVYSKRKLRSTFLGIGIVWDPRKIFRSLNSAKKPEINWDTVNISNTMNIYNSPNKYFFCVWNLRLRLRYGEENKGAGFCSMDECQIIKHNHLGLQRNCGKYCMPMQILLKIQRSK